MLVGICGTLIYNIVLSSVFHGPGSFTLPGPCVSAAGSPAAELPPKEGEEDIAQPPTRGDSPAHGQP